MTWICIHWNEKLFLSVLWERIFARANSFPTQLRNGLKMLNTYMGHTVSSLLYPNKNDLIVRTLSFSEYYILIINTYPYRFLIKNLYIKNVKKKTLIYKGYYLKTLFCFQCGAFSGSLFIYFKHMFHLKAARLNKLINRKHKKKRWLKFANF